MNSEQIDAAMRDRLPVVYAGIRYDRIIEYICFYDQFGKRRLSVNLQMGRSCYRVPAEKVELA